MSKTSSSFRFIFWTWR